MPDNRPRVLVADDHPMMAEALRKLLEPDFEMVALVEDGRALLKVAEAEQPDLVIADISMPGIDGIEATRRLKKRDPGVRILILSYHTESSWVQAALEAGASGYLAKVSAAAEIEIAVGEVLAGRFYVSPAVAETLAVPGAPSADAPSVDAKNEAAPSGEGAAARLETLTQRELEIAKLVAESLSNKEIAARLHVAVATVRSHLSSIYQKLGLSSRVELALLVDHAGWQEPRSDRETEP